MTLVRRNFLRLACGAIAGSAVAPDVRAQSYPARPIRLVVSVAAGGTNDVTARMIAQKLTEAWGQQVFVDNVPGGGEIVGTGQVAKAEPNGYTALFATGAFTLNPSLHSKLPYDTLKDFTPVTLVASGTACADGASFVAATMSKSWLRWYGPIPASTASRRRARTRSRGWWANCSIEVRARSGARPVQRRRARHDIDHRRAHTHCLHVARQRGSEHQGRQAAGAGADQRAGASRNSRTCRPWRKPGCRSW
jgi:hypothetical protein